MSLFNAVDAVASLKAKHSAAAAANAKRAYADSPRFQQLVQENTYLKGRLSHINDRLDSLESRADTQDQWNQDCQSHVEGLSKPGFPTCPGCGVFYVPGPIPCQGCGYSGANVNAPAEPAPMPVNPHDIPLD